MRYLLFLVSTLGLLHMLITPTFAAVENDPVARVTALRHQAMAINSSGVQRTLEASSEIYRGDTIETGKKGRIQILFPDNTIVSLGRDTTFVINDYLWQPDKQDGKFRSEVKEGVFRVMGGKLTKTVPKNFTTKTPAATIGIRGSIYAGVVTDDLLSVVFLGGRGIFVKNDFGSVEIPRPGYGTLVRAGAPPPPPTPFSGDDLDIFTSGFSDQDDGKGSADNGSSDNDYDETPYQDDPAGTPLSPPPVPTLPPPNEFDQPELDQPEFKPLLPPVSSPWTPPTDGITLFLGGVWGISDYFSDDSQADIDEYADIYANWHNQKILGFVYDPASYGDIPVFFFGDIDGTAVNNIKVFGNDYEDYSSVPMSGVDGSGTGFFNMVDISSFLNTEISLTDSKDSTPLLNTEVMTFDMEGSGSYFDIEPASQPTLGTWQVEGVGAEFSTYTAPRGIETWQGYAIGIAENMNSVDSNRLLLTSSIGDFSLNINKDTGILSGSLSVRGGDFSLNNIAIGGAYDSAFIDDHIFAAILGGDSSVVDGYGSLKPRGNFLVTGSSQFMEYATWGYWETAFIYPETSNQYHNHAPNAMWVAGPPTSVADLTALHDSEVVGSYSGSVMASKIDTSSTVQVSEVTGTVDIVVDFSMLGNTSAITGNMDLDGNLFTIDSSGTAGSPHFSSTLNGGGFTGNLNGTMYGPGAQSIGGNFKTSDGDGVITYQGIYGGNR